MARDERELAGSWRPNAGTSATTSATVFLALLYLLSARLVVPGFGGVATPANLWALLVGLVWLYSKSSRTTRIAKGDVQPVRWALFLYGAWFLVTYAVLHQGMVTVVTRVNSDRMLIETVAAIAIAVSVADGIWDRHRLDVLLRRLVLLGVVFASIGIVQFATPFDPVTFLRPPVLAENLAIVEGRERSIFVRPNSTALHPIEYGVVLAALISLALHYALMEADRTRRCLRYTAVCIMAVAIPVSVSRSAVISLAISVGVLSTAWTWRRRLNVLVAGTVFAAMTGLAVPGLIGTLRGLFRRVGSDPSIQGRVDDFAEVRDLIASNPVTGLGPGAFNPTDYFVVDNEYLYRLVSTGIPGFITLVVIVVMPLVVLWRVGRCAADEGDRHLSRALMGSIAACAAGLATFDGFSFRIFLGTLFLLTGVSGALWRVTAGGTEPARAGAGSDVRAESGPGRAPTHVPVPHVARG